jgi:hypothetical protein
VGHPSLHGIHRLSCVGFLAAHAFALNTDRFCLWLGSQFHVETSLQPEINDALVAIEQLQGD